MPDCRGWCAEAKRDRQVMRQARERLNRRRADAAELAAARERRETLVRSLERHASAPWEPLYAGRLRHLMREWQQLEDTPRRASSGATTTPACAVAR